MKDSIMKLAVRSSVSLCVLLMAMSLPLSADPLVVFAGVGGVSCGSAGTCTNVAGATTITFDGLDGQTGPQNFGPATYTPVGSGSPFVTGTTGNHAAPPGDSTTYLTLGSNGGPTAVDITFSSAMSYFGFYMGSPDTYNHISFEFYSGSHVETFSGIALGGTADGNQLVGRYLNFNAASGGPGITKIRMYSDAVAFETDNHAYKAVPDGGVTLMLLGGVLVGLESLRRKFRV